jgi:hypothetical protein
MHATIPRMARAICTAWRVRIGRANACTRAVQVKSKTKLFIGEE